jgi:putative ABC transport system permease protein
MSWWRQLQRGWRVLTQRAAADRELSDELRHYYDEEIAGLVGQGMTPAAARREVRLRLGDPGNVVEEVRADGWERLVDGITTDLRHSLRRLRRTPGVTLVTVFTLALGIGASTAIVSAVKPILFDALPYADADRLVTIADLMQDGSSLDVTFGTFREIEQRSRSFEAMAAFKPWQPSLTGADVPERLEGQRVGARYFRVLRVRPLLGRDFTDEEDRERGANVVLLGHGLWQRRFGGDREIVGRLITLNDAAFTVVGVLPPAFENVLSPAAEVWAPLQYDDRLPADGREWGHHLRVVARLLPAVSLRAAARELDLIAQTPLPPFVRMPWASMQGGINVRALREAGAAGRARCRAAAARDRVCERDQSVARARRAAERRARVARGIGCRASSPAVTARGGDAVDRLAWRRSGNWCRPARSAGTGRAWST